MITLKKNNFYQVQYGGAQPLEEDHIHDEAWKNPALHHAWDWWETLRELANEQPEEHQAHQAGVETEIGLKK